MTVSQVDIPISLGDTQRFGGTFPAPDITSRFGQQKGASSYQEKNFTENMSTPKYGGRFILESMPNGSHQVNTRSLIYPCFTVLCKTKLGDEC